MLATYRLQCVVAACLLSFAGHCSNLVSKAESAIREKLVHETDPEKHHGLLEELRRIQMREMIKSEQAPISFYGKVIDQYTNPVENAKVEVRLQHFKPLDWMASKTIVLSTDAQGNFGLSGETGTKVYIHSILKNGYELNWASKPKISFDYPKDLVEGYRFVPDKDNPVVFHLRKKGETTYIIEQHRGARASLTNVTIKWFDFVKKLTSGTNLPKRVLYRDLHCDLQISALFCEEGSNYVVTFKAPDPKGGILFSKKLLYVAPKEGYKPEYVTTVKLGDWNHKLDLYMKSRDPVIYSRIDVEFNPRRHLCGIHFDVWTNPYGSRNLEPELNMPYELEERLAKEAKEALLSGRLPKQPNLKELLKDASNE